jgi:putative acetyltransferase
MECVLPSDNVVVRSENTEERSAVRSVNEAAFGRPDEADLVDRLWAEGIVLVSLVAELRKQIVGHILFSRMSIDTPSASIPAVALAPMAVLPEYQRRAIGERLIRDGLDLLRGQGEHIVLVLGHPDYYPRFGFSAEKARSLESPFPPNAFMAMELSPDALDWACGKVRYPVAFGL